MDPERLFCPRIRILYIKLDRARDDDRPSSREIASMRDGRLIYEGVWFSEYGLDLGAWLDSYRTTFLVAICLDGELR